jgi:predicted TIM-barrel fold metal-dependent hydrolase
MTITLEALRGRVTDVDSHEMMPVGCFEPYFGDRAVRFMEAAWEVFKDLAESQAGRPDTILVDVEDTMDITDETVWTTKGPGAPGAFDFDRRPEVLDAMGIGRQLVFPGFGFLGFILGLGGLSNNDVDWGKITPYLMERGWAAVDAHNEWAAELTSRYPDRLRMVGMQRTGAAAGATPESMAKEAERLIGTGLRAVYIASGVPPAGLSPADRALDPYYATLAEADVPLTFHVGGGGSLFATDVWGRVPEFRYQYQDFAESSGEPYTLCHFHMAEENFLAVMTLGGVFERHPTLRVGAIELGASWIGPLAERMDWFTEKHDHLWAGGDNLSMRPSEYLNRNVRVTPYHHEPVEVWLERYPMLQDVYCFSTDYPHLEGGNRSLQRFFDRVAPLGDEVTEKFFCTNGQLLVP